MVFTLIRSAGLALAVAALAAPAGRADQIDRVLVHDAADIAKVVGKLKARNVAVLKFQVDLGDGKPTFRAGTEGADMVRRLENILILTNDPEMPTLNVLTGAGPAAADLARATRSAVDWTTAAGRQQLFGLSLPLAWDDAQKLAPDAYVTGTVRASKDLKELFIDLVGFGKADPAKLVKLGTLGGIGGGTAKGIRMDRSILASLGQTFTASRSLKVKALSRDLFAADESAAEDAAARNSDPAPEATIPGPVKLEIVLDGAPAELQPDPSSRGEFKVAQKTGSTPGVGQKVQFALTNTSSERIAVLLCVNGKNTAALDNEDLAAPDKPRDQFRMWVLEPDIRYEIRGFQKSASEYSEFEVAPTDRSNEHYEAMSPAFRGKIQMFTYGKKPLPVSAPADAEATAPAPSAGTEKDDFDPLADMNEATDAAGLASHDRSLAQSRSLRAAQASLSRKTKLSNQNGTLAPARARVAKSREMILPGETRKTEEEVKVVAFKYDPNPLDSVVISYYSRESAHADPLAPQE